MRQRLLRAFLFMLLLVLGLIVLIYGWSVNQSLQAYQRAHISDHVQFTHGLLDLYYRKHDNWTDVEQELIPLAVSLGLQVVIIDPETERVLASSSPLAEPGEPFTPDPIFRHNFVLYDETNRDVGLAYITINNDISAVDNTLTASLASGFLLAMSLATLVAIALATYFSRTITQPLREIDAAARQLAHGNYDVRLAVPPTKDEVALLAQTFNQMAGQLGTIEALRRQLVADVSHDLNTPLTVLRGYLDGLLTGRIVDRQSALKAFGEMQNELDYLQQLVGSLQEAAQADSGQLVVRWAEVDVPTLVSEVVARVQPLAEERGSTLKVDVAEPSPTVWADRLLMGQALYNLLVNALQHNPAGTAVRLVTYPVGTPDEPTHLATAVADNGVGIPPSEQERIFERFYRLDPARSRETGSMGLGLSIVAQIIEAHEGDILLQSEGVAGKGTTFTLVWEVVRE